MLWLSAPVFSARGTALSPAPGQILYLITESFPQMTPLDPLATRRERATSQVYPLAPCCDPLLPIFAGKGAAQPSPHVIFCIYSCRKFLTDDTLDPMVTRREDTPSRVHLTTYFDMAACWPLPAFSTQVSPSQLFRSWPITFLLLIQYVTLWPWTFVVYWLSRDQLCTKFERNRTIHSWAFCFSELKEAQCTFVKFGE